MEPKLNLDVSHLSETERQTIYGVLKRDEDLRKRDEQRINRLKFELQYLRRRGAIRGGSDPLNSCGRCRTELGKIMNRGAPCALCRAKICKMCRVYAKDGSQWICIVCHKQLELEAATGEWMNEFVRRASRKRDKRGLVPPSDIVKELIVRSQSESGHHGYQEERPRRGPALAVTAAAAARPRSGPMEPQRSPAARRRDSVVEDGEAPAPEASARRASACSEAPVPAPRQKSPLLKQRAVLLESETADAPQPVKRQAPPPPLVQHPSDRSDSGIGAEVGGRSPKTSQSSGAPSRQSSGSNGAQAESQEESGSDLSDSEVEPSTGVVFRKVTLRRRKRRDVGGTAKARDSNDARGRRPRLLFADWEDSCCPPAAVVPPWTTFSLPRAHRAPRSPPAPWDDDQLTRTNSSDSLWWDAAACRASSAWLPEEPGVAPGPSRGASNSGLEQRFDWKRSSIRASLRARRRRPRRCRLSASYEDLRVSSPDYEEDSPLDAGLRNADSCSDILGHVNDKIVPEGDEYRIVFISSSSSKSSGLDAEELRSMDDAAWDSAASASPLPPPLPAAPPPQPAAAHDEDIFAYFRGFADAEWKESSLVVAEEESDADCELKRRDGFRTASSRSSGERSVDEQSFFNQVFRERSSPEAPVRSAESPGMDCALSSDEERDSSDEDCAFGSYDVNVSFSEEESEAAAQDRAESESMVDFVELSEEETEADGEDADLEQEDPFLEGLAIPDVQHDSIRRLLDDVERAASGSDKDSVENVDDYGEDAGDALQLIDSAESDEERQVANVEDAGAETCLGDVVGDALQLIDVAGSDEERQAANVEEADVSGLSEIDALQLIDDPDPEEGLQTETTAAAAAEDSGAIAADALQRNDEGSRSPPGEPDRAVSTEPDSGDDSAPVTREVTMPAELEVTTNGSEVTCDEVPKEGDVLGESVRMDCSSVIEEIFKAVIEEAVEERLAGERTRGSDPVREGREFHEQAGHECQPQETEGEAEETARPDVEGLPGEAALRDSTGEAEAAANSDVPEATAALQETIQDPEQAANPDADVGPEAAARSDVEGQPGEAGKPKGKAEEEADSDEETDLPDIKGKAEEEANSDEETDLLHIKGKAEEDADSDVPEETARQDPEAEGLPASEVSQTKDPNSASEQPEEAAESSSYEDALGETSSDGEKLESDTDSLDTVIEGESFRRMRQMAIRQKLLEANSEFDAEAEPEPDPERPKPAPANKPDLQALVAQSRALAESFEQDAEEPGGPGASESVLENYFVSSLEHMAPPLFNRSRSRLPATAPAASPESPPETPDQVSVESYLAGSEDEEFTDSCSETHSEGRRRGPVVSGSDEDSETTFDEDEEDSSSTASTSSDEGSAYLRVAPRPCAPVADDAWYRLDMSLHTIMEESCEESETERERHLEERQRARGRADRSQLERYFRATFEDGESRPATGNANAAPASVDDSEFSDDMFSETESSVFSESNGCQGAGAGADDEELARLASSRLEKYFLTGLLELQVGYPEDPEEAPGTPTPDAEQPAPVAFVFSARQPEDKPETHAEKAAEKTAAAKTAEKTSPPDSSSKEETDEEAPFEKNDGCDTIKRKKKGHLELGLELKDEDAIDVLAETEPEPVSCADATEQTEAVVADADAVAAALQVMDEQVTVVEAAVEETKVRAEPKDQIEDLKAALDKLAQPPLSLPADILAAEPGAGTQLLSWDPSYYGYAEAAGPGLVGRGLTLDWKQQSRDSGFIGSSDDLLQDAGTGDDGGAKEGAAAQPPPPPAEVVVVASAAVAQPQPQPPNPFGLFRSSSTRSNFCAASTTSDDEAQYIVTQLVGHIAKSMSRSPQLARAKPPEIEVFETELAKLMLSVPGIDATVKEIVEELSSTDYCSDSYESSDCDQEAEVTRQALYQLQLRRNDSWRSVASTASKASSEALPEDAMDTYQRFMDSLAKMTEQAEGEARPASAASGSPPTPVKMLQHIRSKLTSLMREVHAEGSPLPRIAWSKPSSGSGSAAGDELSLSSTSSANLDSEDSPTDTEVSMDSADEPAAAATTAAAAAASPPPLQSGSSGDGLERWSSDMTIVDDDVRYSSMRKSEPILSLPESSRTLPAARYGGASQPSPHREARPRSIGSLTHLMASSQRGSQCRSSKSEWEVWRDAGEDAGGDVSKTASAPRTPYKHKSCDVLPSARGRKKHGFAFMLRQKSGSSASLEPAAKQQIQFRSQHHLRTQPQPQPQPPRASSLQRLFGKAAKRQAPSVKSCWSSPDVGVDDSTADVPAPANVTSIYVPSGAYSTQDLSANPRAKASTLPRAASQDLRANVSFLHKPPAARRNLTRSTNTLPHSYTLLVPQPEAAAAAGRTPPQPRQQAASRSAAGTAATAAAPAAYAAKSVVQVVPPESPKTRRETQSWPVTDGPSDAVHGEVTTVSVGGQAPAPRAKSLSPPAVTLKYTSHVPSIQVAECPERTAVRGSGASSHTGSSDPDSMTEEDIDRLVALHKNRSLSSLGVCSESMSSVYSAAGGGHYGTVTVRGEVQFGLSYNYVSGALEVHIKQCRDLAPVDAKRNRSDPYVKVYLLPDKSKSGKRKTRVKKHTLNPLFNEILKFHVTISELETRTLWMTVWHSDMFGRNEFLGEVTLPMGYEAWDDTSPKWYILQERLGPPEEVYSYKGDLVLALKFVPPDVAAQKKGRHSRGALHVLVKEARNLMAVCANGTSDPFCKCYLLPEKGKGNKQKTHVVKRSCNPKWNHTFVYEDISLEQLHERCLELTVWDYDRLTSNDFLGGVRLSLGAGRHQGKKMDWFDSRAEEIAMWQTMLENPNVWVDATILLRPTMDHRQASTW